MPIMLLICSFLLLVWLLDRTVEETQDQIEAFLRWTDPFVKSEKAKWRAVFTREQERVVPTLWGTRPAYYEPGIQSTPVDTGYTDHLNHGGCVPSIPMPKPPPNEWIPTK